MLRQSPFGPVSRPWTVSRQGVVKAKRPCVAKWKLCRDRGRNERALGAHDRRRARATDFPKFSVTTKFA